MPSYTIYNVSTMYKYAPLNGFMIRAHLHDNFNGHVLSFIHLHIFQLSPNLNNISLSVSDAISKKFSASAVRAALCTSGSMKGHERNPHTTMRLS